MRFAVKIFTSVLIGLLCACASSDSRTNKNYDEITDLKIKLERGGCFGFCPIYNIEITGNGKVTYCGVAFVEEIGSRTRQIDPNEVRSLYNQILSANFFSLRDKYIANITDVAGYTVSVSFDDKTKTIFDYFGQDVGMPDTITKIQNSIDKVAKVSEWVGDNKNDYSFDDWEEQKC